MRRASNPAQESDRLASVCFSYPLIPLRPFAAEEVQTVPTAEVSESRWSQSLPTTENQPLLVCVESAGAWVVP